MDSAPPATFVPGTFPAQHLPFSPLPGRGVIAIGYVRTSLRFSQVTALHDNVDDIRALQRLRVSQSSVIVPALLHIHSVTHWPTEDAKSARDWMLDAMEAYHRAMRIQGTLQSITPGPASTVVGRAAESQAQRVGRLQRLAAVRRSTSYSSAASSTPSPSLSTSTSDCSASRSMPLCQDVTVEQHQQQEIQVRIEDRKAAERELQRYEADGTRTDGSGERNSDLVRFWGLHENIYPLLFRVAMDVLPTQASSVLCERVFSSSKETCALRRNSLSPRLLEALQVLKFKYKQEGLSFTSDFIAKPQDYSITESTERAALELITTGGYGELHDLIVNNDSSGDCEP